MVLLRVSLFLLLLSPLVDASSKISDPVIGTSVPTAKEMPKSLQMSSVDENFEMLGYNYEAIKRLFPTSCAANAVSFEGDFDSGKSLRDRTRLEPIETVVARLDQEIKNRAEHKSTSDISVMIHGFFEEFYDDFLDQVVRTAIKIEANKLLQGLLAARILPPNGRVTYLAMIHAYDKEWCDKALWEEISYSMDWEKNLEAIKAANNPRFFDDLLKCKAPLDRFSQALRLDLIAEHDLDNYVSPSPAVHKELAERLETLAKAGSLKLLRLLVESKTLERLHLEKHSVPAKLPRNLEDFDFFMAQGGDYLSTDKLIVQACRTGNDFFLDQLFRRIEGLDLPKASALNQAAVSGQLSILNWAKTKKIKLNVTNFATVAIMNGHLEVVKWLKAEDCGYSTLEAQKLTNFASRRGKHDIVKWLFEELQVVPETEALKGAGSKILDLVKSVYPERIDALLKLQLNTTVLEWLSKNDYARLFTDAVKKHQINTIDSFKKMLWIYENWQELPLEIDWVIEDGDAEALEWAFNKTGMIPSRQKIHDKISRTSVNVIKWMHQKYSPWLEPLDELTHRAINKNVLELAQYLNADLDPTQKESISLLKACKYGNLEMLKWVYDRYSVLPSKECIDAAIHYNQPEIIGWIAQTDPSFSVSPEHVSLAIDGNCHEMCRILVFYQEEGILPLESDLESGYSSGNLELFKALIAKGFNFEVYKFLKHASCHFGGRAPPLYFKKWAADYIK